MVKGFFVFVYIYKYQKVMNCENVVFLLNNSRVYNIQDIFYNFVNICNQVIWGVLKNI